MIGKVSVSKASERFLCVSKTSTAEESLWDQVCVACTLC